MNPYRSEHQHELQRGGRMDSRTKWVLAGFLGIAALLLVIEHRTHVFGWLSSYGIWLVLLACPLMHVFMHRGHGHGGHGHHPGREPGDTRE
jgi:hypothetical protein